MPIWTFPWNINLWWIFWLHLIYPFQQIHFPDSFHSFLHSLPWPLRHFHFVSLSLRTITRAPKSHTSNNFASSLGVLAQVLFLLSWESSPKSVNCFLLYYILVHLIKHPQNPIPCVLPWLMPVSVSQPLKILLGAIFFLPYWAQHNPSSYMLELNPSFQSGTQREGEGSFWWEHLLPYRGEAS